MKLVRTDSSNPQGPPSGIGQCPFEKGSPQHIAWEEAVTIWDPPAQARPLLELYCQIAAEFWQASDRVKTEGALMLRGGEPVLSPWATRQQALAGRYQSLADKLSSEML